jgi:hypothetical protein
VKLILVVVLVEQQMTKETMDQIATALTSGLVEWINRQNRVKKNSVY